MWFLQLSFRMGKALIKRKILIRISLNVSRNGLLLQNTATTFVNGGNWARTDIGASVRAIRSASSVWCRRNAVAIPLTNSLDWMMKHENRNAWRLERNGRRLQLH